MANEIKAEVQAIRQYYAPFLQKIKETKASLEKFIWNPCGYRSKMTLETFLNVGKAISYAQENVLILRGYLSVRETNDPNELVELGSYFKSKGYVNLTLVGQMMREHHLNLIDLLEGQASLTELVDKITSKVVNADERIESGWINPETGCRSTYHRTFDEIIKVIENGLALGVTMVSGDIGYYRKEKLYKYAIDSHNFDSTIDILNNVKEGNNGFSIKIKFYYEDPTKNRILIIKSDPTGLLKLSIDRLTWIASIYLLEDLVNKIKGVSDYQLIDKEQRSLLRTYLKAHLNLIKDGSFTGNRQFILPLYYSLGRDPEYRAMMRFDNDSGLKDPLTTISKIHQRYGCLINGSGKLKFYKGN